ncbi:MAG: asparaginase [Bacillus sp. (in: firmicutes)]
MKQYDRRVETMEDIVVLVEEYRGELVENRQLGIVCGTDCDGVLFQAGDISQYVYLRSAAKPVQAISFFMAGIREAFQLSPEEAALCISSHHGEKQHVRHLESLMSKLSVSEKDLYCPPAYPKNKQAREEVIKRGIGAKKLFHNCSGKHLGMIATCKKMGYPLEGYWKPEHPLQIEITGLLAELAEMPIMDVRTGIDGCGLPVMAIPLESLAVLSRNLASPDLINDQEVQKAAKQVTSLMNEYHTLISSAKHVNALLLADQNIVAKSGMDGVLVVGLKKERVGIAIKIINGSDTRIPQVISAILKKMNYENEETMSSLDTVYPLTIVNDRNERVGHMLVKLVLDR